MKKHWIMIGVAAVVLYLAYKHFAMGPTAGESTKMKTAIRAQEMGAELSNWQL